MDVASVAEVDAFLGSTPLDSYHSMPLPHGRRTPGADAAPRAESILAGRVDGKSVLDVGTHHGYFAYEAVRRGATRVVGVERNEEHWRVADRIAELHGRPYEVLHASAESLPFSEPFDVVLFLNVLHHVADPVATLRNLVTVCRETLIIEFPTPADPLFVSRVLGANHRSRAPHQRLGHRLRLALLTRLLTYTSSRVPLVGVGAEPYRNTFHFSPTALEYLFTIHQPLLAGVVFTESPSKGRLLAICSMPDARPLRSARRFAHASRVT